MAENVKKIYFKNLAFDVYLITISFLLVPSSGVCHADDLAYIFYPRILSQLGIGKPPDPGSTEHLVIQRVTQMWTNFAKTGYVKLTPDLSGEVGKFTHVSENEFINDY